MEIGFNHIKDMTIGDVLKLKQDKERLEKENLFMKTKYPKAKEELEADDLDINELIESL